MLKTHTPGLSVAIVRKGQTLLARGHGLADIATGRPVTADTAFHVASVSKTVTGTAMMMLFQDAKPYDASGNAPVALPPVGYPDWPSGLLRTSARDFARFLAVYTIRGTLDGRVYLAISAVTTSPRIPAAIPACRP
ncbi:serine hydrolase [Stigmatella aurantiaca]|uniref:Beta-lactamase family protein n=1 Tax=Stigmatella aurantiaca (strain DW4/3-1) TaxID=378806 RepID=E3FU33_STIAD|nr:serine hydrolase domain-containing protein [Stigmatella aurantiaca]ADO72173.1 Beta-lactamase family protein [Stigmatella aurantiaca DW4/3-1]